MIRLLDDFNQEITENIAYSKSSSQISGYKLRNSHYKLGNCLAKKIKKEWNKECYTVFCMMRSGLCFAFGIADELERLASEVKIIFSSDDFSISNVDVKESIIIVDGVINSGKTILGIMARLKNEQVLIATNVISKKACDILSEYEVYAVRVSDNYYVGTKEKIISMGKGPDTSERLFNSKFFE